MGSAPPITRIAILFVAGLTAGYVFLVPPALVWLALALAGIAFLLPRRAYYLAFTLLGVGFGTISHARHEGDCTSRWRPGRHSAWIMLHDAPGDRALATATVLHAPEGCRGELRLRLEPGAVPGGALALVVGDYRPKLMRVRHIRVVDPGYSRVYSLRRSISLRIQEQYGERAGVVRALVLGNRDGIHPALRRNFIDAGVAHILAISGLHVGIIAGWVALMVGIGGATRARWVLAAIATWLYVALLGFPAPATRAAGFITIHSVSQVRQRHPPWQAVLAVTVLTMVSADPGIVRSVGAWLSVAAVVGTSTGVHLLGNRRRSLGWKLIATSIGATIATAPITAYAFGSVAPIGILTNLVAIPLAGLAVPGVFLGLLWAPFAAGSGVVLAVLERTADFASRFPGGHLSGNGGWEFAYPWVATAALSWWIVRWRPSWRAARVKVLAGAVAVVWGGFVVSVWLSGAARPGLEIHVLDVGQGDAIAVRTPHGRWIIVDGGPRVRGYDAGRSVVLPFLRRQRAHSLDLVLVSHGDADHLGGIPAIISRMAPRLIVESGRPVGSALYLEHLAAVDESGADWQALRSGDTLVVDSVVLSVEHPSREWSAGNLETNENSLVVRLAYRSFSLLLTGDAGAVAESAFVRGMSVANVLKVGHHGASTGTTALLLDALRPQAAVISVGRGNSYGHPAPKVIERLSERDIPVFQTDRGGTVTIWTNGSYFDIRQNYRHSNIARLGCIVRALLRSRGSSSSRSACLSRPPVSSRVFSTTLR